MPRSLLLILTVTLTTVIPSQARGQDRYFVMIFGSEPKIKSPYRCHTWGTIVKCTETHGVPKLKAHTISWVPADLKIRLLTVCSKPGVNLDLAATIERYRNLNGQVSVWGPYEIQDGSGPSIYERTLQQIARLESGEVRYMAIDPVIGPRTRIVSDCIHAITDIDQMQGRSAYSELLRFGDSASQFIVKVLADRGRINRCERHEWVLEALGLDQCGIVRR